MVRANIMLAVILAVILTGGILENIFIRKEFKYFSENLENITDSAEKGEDSSGELQKLLDWWKKEKHILHAFIPHNEIKEIDGIMVEAKTLMAFNDYGLASTRLKKLSDTVKAIPDNYSFNFGNIF